MTEESFRPRLDEVRSGDQSAAAEITRQYTAALVGLARRQIGPRLGQRVDPEDIVQSTYRSLFVRLREGEYELGSGEDLWRLLAAMTLNKVRRQARFHAARRRDMRLEAASGELVAEHVDGGQPGPEEAAELVDELQALVAHVRPRDRAIVELRLQGLSTAQIAAQTQRAERSVRRVLQQVREQLEAANRDNDPVR